LILRFALFVIAARRAPAMLPNASWRFHVIPIHRARQGANARSRGCPGNCAGGAAPCAVRRSSCRRGAADPAGSPAAGRRALAPVGGERLCRQCRARAGGRRGPAARPHTEVRRR
jgi:hypothetical protein